ncbi:MAG: hydantoinase B/oxoprolinase family protein [Alphaproteobacteria bacterium]|nr:hydantoinase B/oxoprolinase family protein [Alphaproteobacteria bacterium]
MRADLMAMLSVNVRHPKDFQGDLAAQIGSVRLGEKRLETLITEFSAEVVGAAVEVILDSAEQQARAVIDTWADGVYEGVALLDDDGRGNQDIAVRAKVTVQGSELEIDLSETDDQVTSFINSSHANTQSAVAMALAYLFDPETPKNDGSLRPVKVIVRPGSLVAANPSAPVTLSTSHSAQEVIEAIVRALAPACPDRAMAGWGRRFRIAIKGDDPRNGKPFIWHMFHARPGAGASPGGDGWHGTGEWHSAGGLKFGSVEVAESRFPLFFERHEYRPDSGGDGRHTGGAGVDLELRVETDTDCVANTAGDGARHGACGLLGGADGAPHRYLMRVPNQVAEVLATKREGITVPPGTVFEVHSAGGGGWGPPAERDPAARDRDRMNGYVSNSAGSV